MGNFVKIRFPEKQTPVGSEVLGSSVDRGYGSPAAQDALRQLMLALAVKEGQRPAICNAYRLFLESGIKPNVAAKLVGCTYDEMRGFLKNPLGVFEV